MAVKRKLFVEATTPRKKTVAKSTLSVGSGTEVKRAFEQLTPAAATDGTVFRGTGVRLFQIPRGDTQNTRIGRSITARGVRVQYQAKNNSGGSQSLRVLVIRAKNLGYNATVENIYGNLLQTLGNNRTLPIDTASIDDVDRLIYPVDTDRFEVLAKKTFHLGKNNNEGSHPAETMGSFYVKFKPRKVRFYDPIPASNSSNPFPLAEDMSEHYFVLAYTAHNDLTNTSFSTSPYGIKMLMYYTDN